MDLWSKLKPSFLGKQWIAPGASSLQFNYSLIWKLAVVLSGGVSLVPLVFITVVNYEVMQHAIESDFLLRTTRVVSNTRRTISFFLTERKSALDFIVHDNSFESLNKKERLSGILDNLKRSFGKGFVDIGIIDSTGYQRNYIGPYRLEGKDYSDQEWFKQVVDQGVYISDVFLGYRHIPHLIIAVKSLPEGDSFYVLRAALSIAPFEDIVSTLELDGKGDAFIINHNGILQTSSRYHGRVLESLPMTTPGYSPKTEVFEERNQEGQDLVIGYRYIDQSPFILMIVKRKQDLMKPWFSIRLKLIAFLLFSVSCILTVILGTATFMVKKIKLTDEKRVLTLHQVEYSNKMASIGRMAANVAHEINNPLAIINEKAGFIKDLFTIKKEYAADNRLIHLVDSILLSVKRAGTITKRLLTFARNMELSIEPIHLKSVIEEVLSFMGNEAKVRDIDIKIDIPLDIPVFESDRGKLQQIFVNIINNAFAAVPDGGHLDITAGLENEDFVYVSFADDGCGIHEEDVDRVFEPFFSTKTGQGGTGLGLSITYNLVQEIGGRIYLESEPDRGTRFTIHIPVRNKK